MPGSEACLAVMGGGVIAIGMLKELDLLLITKFLKLMM